jgi:DNA polymerase III epsilon subunit-like protein
MIPLYAFLDTETTGLIENPDLPLAEQPHLLEIAVKLTTKDGHKVGGFERIIKPEGWSIDPEAEKVHGISADLAAQCGVELWFAMADLKATLTEATCIIGHNIHGFDRKIISYSLERVARAGYGGDQFWWAKQARKIVDIQELATPILRLPGQFGEYKFPKLHEAARFFGMTDYMTTHRAGPDLEAVEHIYWAIIRGADRATA